MPGADESDRRLACFGTFRGLCASSPLSDLGCSVVTIVLVSTIPTFLVARTSRRRAWSRAGARVVASATCAAFVMVRPPSL